MAKPRSLRDDIPDDATPTLPVGEPILSGPYDEPTEHWIYQKQGNVSVPIKAGGRRPASYFYKTKRLGTAQLELEHVAEEGRDLLELPNRLRADVKRWRTAGYR